MRARDWLRSAADLVIPVRCLGCERRSEAWCTGCVGEALQMRVRDVDALEVVAAAGYDGATREALLLYKERGRRDLAGPLGWLLTAAVDAASAGLREPVLVPMPSTAGAARRRGGDHLLRLVRRIPGDRAVARTLGTRAGVDAVELSAAARALARRRSMYARGGADELLRGRDVLLVDDIVTTGSTLRRAGQIVAALGARRVRAAVIAETEKQVASR